MAGEAAYEVVMAISWDVERVVSVVKDGVGSVGVARVEVFVSHAYHNMELILYSNTDYCDQANNHML